jgi:hypothetical protein
MNCTEFTRIARPLAGVTTHTGTTAHDVAAERAGYWQAKYVT